MFYNTLPLRGISEFEPTGTLSTIPFLPAEEVNPVSAGVHSMLTSSVLEDLRRFKAEPLMGNLLAVLAASVRHDKPLSVSLIVDGEKLGLTIHPRRQVFYCTTDLCTLPDPAFAQLLLERIEPEAEAQALLGSGLTARPLRPLLWHLAMRGPHADLLPELAGNVRCRMVFGTSLEGLPLDRPVRRAVLLMKVAPISLDDLLPRARLGRVTAQRVWNALYLQSALMVTRAY
jgi:hypothetical protein